jgi:hypothetical protein
VGIVHTGHDKENPEGIAFQYGVDELAVWTAISLEPRNDDIDVIRSGAPLYRSDDLHGPGSVELVEDQFNERGTIGFWGTASIVSSRDD